MKIFDTLLNLVSRFGTSQDKNTYNQFQFNELTQQELELGYRGDWIARKSVNIPAQDETRAWRGWQADPAEIEDLEAEEKRLSVQRKLKNALIKARLYGGSAIVMGLPGAPAQEVDFENLTKGDLKFLHVLSRYEIRVPQVDRDVTSDFYGQPKMYELQPVGGNPVQVHPSRVVRFQGIELPRIEMTIDGWGDSVLQATNDAIQNVALTSAGIAGLVNESKMDVLKIPNFMDSVGTAEYRDRMLSRLSLVNTSKSMMSTILTDKEEEWTRIQTSFAYLPDILKLYLLIASGAADIPATRFLGQSAVGLGATGEGDLRNYYDAVKSDQETELSPAIERLDDAVIRSALGDRPDEIYYNWNSLWQLTAVEKSTIAYQKAQTYKSDSDTATLDPDVMARARLAQLVEDGTYPGLEGLIDDADNEGLPEDNAEVQAQFAAGQVDPKTGQPVPAAPQIDPETGEPIPPKSAPQQQAQDAEPRSLYVRRDVVNTPDILKWARANFDTTIAADQLHVTVVYSRAAVDWMKIREDCSYGPSGPDGKVPAGGMYVAPGGPRLVDRLGPAKDVVVLMFASSSLCWRHESIQQGGASWDWPEYQPHITISYQVPSNVDVTKIEPYRGEIILGPEIFEEVKDGYKEGIVEQ